MSDQAELAFIKSFVSILAPIPPVYPDDYQQPPENRLKKLPIIPFDLPPPPKRDQSAPSLAAGSITVHFKSLKPAYTFTLSVSPSDPISSIKAQLASTPNAPPADAQRLLLKGKALADSKLLQEYAIKDGDTLNLLLKPGVAWDPTAPAPAETMSTSESTLKPGSSPSLAPIVTMTPPEDSEPSSKPKRGHTRIPSVVLSPSPSSTSPLDEKPADIPLTFDTTEIPTASEAAGPPRTTYHATISDPVFWEKLYAFLKTEFALQNDAQDAFEDFLNSSKGSLSAHEIAKIRDHVGIFGMAGK